MASLCASAMYAITPVALASLQTSRPFMPVHAVADSFRAVSLWLASRSAELDLIRDLIGQAANDDDALLVACTP